jgi:endoglycosylceramidase
VGYDLMNEPNAFNPTQVAGLSALAGSALAEIRRNEREARGFPHIMFVEPAPVWPLPGFVPTAFAHDDQIAYAPHIYNGGLTDGPIPREDFAQARTDAAALGNAPVLVGEWGSDPRRASDPADGYFAKHQALQDEWRYSATLWTWRESCGDPHKAGDVRAGQVPYVWGEFEVDCRTNTVTGPRRDLVAALRRATVRAAPGQLRIQASSPSAGTFLAIGDGATRGTALDAFVPADRSAITLASVGLVGVRAVAVPGGTMVRGVSTGGVWGVAITPR